MKKSTLKTCNVYEMNVAEMKAYHGGAILGALVLLGAAGVLLAVEAVWVVENIYSSHKGGL